MSENDMPKQKTEETKTESKQEPKVEAKVEPKQEVPPTEEPETPKKRGPKPLILTPQQREMLEGKYSTVKEVAAEFKFSMPYILRLCREGRLKAAKQTGFSWRIPESEVERFRQSGIERIRS